MSFGLEDFEGLGLKGLGFKGLGLRVSGFRGKFKV